MREGRVELAIDALQQALRINPTVRSHQGAFAEALRMKESRALVKEGDKLRQVGRVEEAMEAYRQAVELDPDLEQALNGVITLSDEQHQAIRVSRLSKRVTLRFRNAGLKEVFEGLSRAAGINMVFDKDVRNDPVTIFIEETPFREALNLILTSNNLFSREVSPDTLLISPNTRQKQDQYQEQMIRTFYLSNAKAKDMVTLLKTMLSFKRVYANQQLNAVVVRDQADKLQLAERVIQANDRRESEVLLDVEVLEITRTKQEKYGLDFPKQAGVGLVPPGFSGTLTAALAQQFTWSQLTDVGGDNFIFKLPTAIIVDFLKSVTDSKILASPKIRVMNNKKAEINIGAKEPILLSTTNVLPGSTTTGAVPSTSTVTSIEFRDTGVKLVVEPTIHLRNALSLKIKIEFIRVGDKVILQESPRIESNRFGNRTTETTLHVKDGETIVIAGLIQEEDRQTRDSIPLLGDIPGLGDLFSSFETTRVTTEIVLTITPRIIHSLNPPSPSTQAFWSGTEFYYTDKPLFSKSTTPKMWFPDERNGVFPEKAMAPRARARARAWDGGPAGTRPAGARVPLVGKAQRLIVTPSDVATEMGEEVAVVVGGEHLDGLREGVVIVEYDPQILEFKTVAEGELLRRHGVEGSMTVSSDAQAGALRLTMRGIGAPASGTGDLVMVTFVGKAPGVSPVSVQMAHGAGGDNGDVRSMSTRGVVRVR